MSTGTTCTGEHVHDIYIRVVDILKNLFQDLHVKPCTEFWKQWILESWTPDSHVIMNIWGSWYYSRSWLCTSWWPPHPLQSGSIPFDSHALCSLLPRVQNKAVVCCAWFESRYHWADFGVFLWQGSIDRHSQCRSRAVGKCSICALYLKQRLLQIWSGFKLNRDGLIGSICDSWLLHGKQQTGGRLICTTSMSVRYYDQRWSTPATFKCRERPRPARWPLTASNIQ